MKIPTKTHPIRRRPLKNRLLFSGLRKCNSKRYVQNVTKIEINQKGDVEWGTFKSYIRVQSSNGRVPILACLQGPGTV